VTYHSVLRTVDYGAGAMRDEIVLSRAEPRGGGYPLSGQQRNLQPRQVVQQRDDAPAHVPLGLVAVTACCIASVR
jgi:hypothetical protein